MSEKRSGRSLSARPALPVPHRYSQLTTHNSQARVWRLSKHALRSCFALSLFASFGVSVARAGAPAPAVNRPELAAAFVKLLTAGDFTGAADRFSANLRAVLTADDVRHILGPPLARAGAFKAQLAVTTDGDLVSLTAECESGAIIRFAVVIDDTGHVQGLGASPGELGHLVPPAYVDLTRFIERDLTVGDGDWTLPATLSLPRGSGRHPAVVLVPGSGDVDRDETTGPNKPFRDLAWGLASRGIVVLRYEKRSRSHALEWNSLRPRATLKEETIDDARAAIALLRQTPEVDANRIFVLGHGLGGFAAPRIAQAEPGLAGLIVMSGNAQPLEDEMLHQVEYLYRLHGRLKIEAPRVEQMKRSVAKAKDPALTAATPADQLPGGGSFSAACWLDLRGYHPAEAAAALNRRVLVIGGENDWETPPQNIELWRQALAKKTTATVKLYPGLNHFLMPGPPHAEELDYAKPDHVAEGVIADLADWINGKR